MTEVFQSEAAISNFACNFLVTSAKPTFESVLLLPSPVFAAFMLLSVLALLFVKFIVPETRNTGAQICEQKMEVKLCHFKFLIWLYLVFCVATAGVWASPAG